MRLGRREAEHERVEDDVVTRREIGVEADAELDERRHPAAQPDLSLVRAVDARHLVGGGARNELLCRWTAAAAGIPVLAGPEEATLLGNLLVQAMTLGELASVDEAREVVPASFAPTTYEPERTAEWVEARERFAHSVSLPTLEVGA